MPMNNPADQRQAIQLLGPAPASRLSASASDGVGPQAIAGAHRSWARDIAVGVTILAALAVLYTIYFARPFLLPIAVAILLSFLLSPLIRALARIHIPAPAAAALLVFTFAAVVAGSCYELARPVEGWITHAPETMRRAGARLRVLARPVDQVTKAANEVERATAANSGVTATEVVVKGPTLADRFLGISQAFVASMVEVVLLLFFLLAGGDMFLEKLVKVLPRLGDKRTAVTIARTIESSVSRYLLTTAALNILEGVLVTIAMWALGMPTPFVWGALITCLEFIPYVGMAVAIAAVAVASLTTFSNLSQALVVPGAVVAINLVQANLVNPLVMSKRLTLNPVALFVGLAFWWWVWGIPGALIAVPLLATFKIVCDHLAPLAPVGEFLGGRSHAERDTWLYARGARIPDPESSPAGA